ncbi:pseudouridine synthase [Kangiella sediminilitoris]|uniref:Pseudouridine synthase n=1 Tax=Kangiella sediminilitoris TaxID=1144748 RepID=A0A1B3B9Y3_9GAMM|nr:pseudouridine synthase [Kangiella sediminilitoris]AOE49603.1 pseudouridine synthase [Kangiella sediminilitoris]
MPKSEKASKVSLPQEVRYRTILAFLVEKFPHVSEKEWIQRMEDKQVYKPDGTLISSSTPYQAGPIYYHRQVTEEPKIPFKELIIEQNDDFLIAYKPHYLPIMPGGAFVNECLQQRLINITGNMELQAIHRLDRDTAGLVLFSTNATTRHHYHQLFSQRKVDKQYQAIATISDDSTPVTGEKWHVKNYIKRSTPDFLFQNIEATDSTSGGWSAESIIECTGIKSNHAFFNLSPITGRTHQLRLHMLHIGHPILNDRFYPELQPKSSDDFNNPLKLLAYSLSFTDPISQQRVSYQSPVSLEI